MHRCWIGAALVFALAGCASYFKRKDCEKTNWYQHGYDVAMSGKRLDADDYIEQCRRVKAEVHDSELDVGFKAGMSRYCTGDNVYAVGKAGHVFSYDMCDGESTKKMRVEYERGLNEFCTPASAYRFGSGGGVYENVCHKDSEEGFLSEYRRGRKVYLTAVIAEKERNVQRLNGEIAALQMQRTSLNYQAANLARSTTTQRTQVFDPTTGTYRESITQVQDPNAKLRSQELENQASSLNWQIQSKQQEQQSLNDELSKLRTEVVAL
jgi:hypothetical protein